MCIFCVNLTPPQGGVGVRLNILIVDVYVPLRSLEQFTLRKHVI